MAGYIFDCETNGLLPDVNVLHSLVLMDIETKEVISCADHPGFKSLEEGLSLLQQATKLVGHNIVKYDIPVLEHLYPGFTIDSDCQVIDTLILSRVWAPELESLDYSRWTHIDSKYKGRHSLAAWGERLGVQKIKFAENAKKESTSDNVWEHWSESMQHYCEQDVAVSDRLYRYFQCQVFDPRTIELEHEFAQVMSLQERFGFPFNARAAYALVNELKARRSELEDELQEIFPPHQEERWSEKTGKQLKTRITPFNPASRQQTAKRLQEKYPEIIFNKTEKGAPKVDDDVLEKLGPKYPEAKLLAEYQLLNKRIGQIAEGKEAWLKHCDKYKDGRIHGEVVTNACISGRCSHKRPNMAQIPSVGHTYGAECRALFYAPEGWKLVGADASGLELRALGAWLAHYDEGDYAALVSNPDRDIHFHNACLFGIHSSDVIDIPKATRDLSKRLIYCILYGGGAKKTGSIIMPEGTEDQQYRKGKQTIDTFYTNLPAIKKLKDDIEKALVTRNYLKGIDGRHLQIRSKHSALNQLLQSTGAIAVKKATTILYKDMIAAGLKFGQDWGFVAHVHDEVQALVRPEYTNIFKELAIDSFRKSGEYFELMCPLTGEARVGQNWMETH
jgi:DNA polymerase I-like protein with 3'-5' exonuclease and polymerase domains